MYSFNGYRKQFGSKGEKYVCEYLKTHGYKLLCRGYLVWGGQIDLIARDMSTNEIVFVEVKTRSRDDWLALDETLTYTQVRTIRKTILKYLFTHELEESDWRIDHIALLLEYDKVIKLEHYINI